MGEPGMFLIGCCALAAAVTMAVAASVLRRPEPSPISGAALRGAVVFDAKGCAGCHALAGEGAHFAPDLARAYDRLGPELVAAILREPERVYRDQARIPDHRVSDREVADLTAFFASARALERTPPRAVALRRVVGPSLPVSHARPRPPIFDQLCLSCHRLGGRGTRVAPALDGIGSRIGVDDLRRLLRDPASVMPQTTMPKLPLSDAQIDALASFLAAERDAVSP